MGCNDLCVVLSVYDSNRTYYNKFSAKVWIVHLKLSTIVSPVSFRPLVREIVLVQQQYAMIEQGEWPSGPASCISFTEVKHGCVRSETGWATFQMKDQNSSLRRPSEGTLN